MRVDGLPEGISLLDAGHTWTDIKGIGIILAGHFHTVTVLLVVSAGENRDKALLAYSVNILATRDPYDVPFCVLRSIS